MRGLIIVAGYLAAYIFLDWVSYIHPIGPFAITPWNPTAGLSVTLLLLLGLRFLPAIFVATLAAEIVVRGFPGSPDYTVSSSAVITIGYGALAAILRWQLGGGRSLQRLREVAIFVASVSIAAGVVAASYVSVMPGRIGAGDFERYVLQFWVGDAIGILVTAPVLLYLLEPRARGGRWRPSLEVAAQAAAVGVALWVVFGINSEEAAKLFYLLFMPLIWIAVRHGLPGAAVALLAIQIGIIVSVQAQGYTSASVLDFQFLMLALAITGLFLGVVVTETRRAREMLESREAEIALVLRTAPDGIVVLDERGRITGANEAAVRMFQGGEEMLVGKELRYLVPGLDLEAAPLQRGEWSARRSDGTNFPLDLALGQVKVGSRRMHIGVLRDVSEQKAIEDQLRERQSELDRSLRLASASETASALAHELNQPLSAIANYVRACMLLLERPGESGERLRETMRKVVSEASRAGDIVRRLRDFYRSGGSHLEHVAVAQLLARSVDAQATRCSQHGIALDVECAPGLPELFVDRTQIETVLHNLLANAIEAIAATTRTERRIQLRAALAGGDSVKLTVSDSGPGLPAEMVDRVFKPFTTTKPDGMGLGLAISRSIIESHGGRLEADVVARGAAFSIILPAQEHADALA